jgi:hypothetical protein
MWMIGKVGKRSGNTEGERDIRFWPLGAVPLDGVSTASIEGGADQRWLG